jgi:hypothetical protein
MTLTLSWTLAKPNPNTQQQERGIDVSTASWQGAIDHVEKLELRLAHVGARKKLAFQQKRQANKKIERQTRLLTKIDLAATVNAPCDDCPLPLVPSSPKPVPLPNRIPNPNPITISLQVRVGTR